MAGEDCGMTDEPHIAYFNMGSWPLYVGFTNSPKRFAKEMRRMGIEGVSFLNPGGNATMHTFVRNGTTTCIIAMEKAKDKSPEMIAALIAHEAVHVAQELWSQIGEEQPGREAEAYLVQMIVQCCLQQVWKTNRVRRTEP
jgi:hypothetical protein